MLIQFTVANHLSFRAPQTLSLIADSIEQTHTDNLITLPPGFAQNALIKVCALYGANGSGKSNVLKALRFFRQLVVNPGSDSEEPVALNPFQLDSKCSDEPTRLEIDFVTEGIHYSYQVVLAPNRILSEVLEAYRQGKPRILLNRNTKNSSFIVTSDWGAGKEIEAVKKITPPNRLFVPLASQFNQDVALRVVAWFRDTLQFISFSSISTRDRLMTESQLHNNPQSASDIVWLFGGAGLDITDVRVSESKAWKELASRFGNNQIPATLPGGFRRYNTTLIRSGLDDKGSPSTVSFDLEEESDGTQKLFALCAPLFSALSVGRVLLIDELDARLHPILTKWLIRAFQLSLKNPMGAQIVFTTHDDNLLDLGLFRRDQIWFVEKDEGGASKLYSLWDFRPRREKNIRNGYMAGLYGGIPFIPESIVRHD